MLRSKLFFTPRFFIGLVGIGFLFMISFFYQEIYPFIFYLLAIFCLVVLVEIVILWSKKTPVSVVRILPERMSNNDKNWVRLALENNSRFKFKLSMREELPHQFNLRDFVVHSKVSPFEKLEVSYEIEPKKRGAYTFGNLNVFLSCAFQLVERKKVFPSEQHLKVYPSYLELQKYDLKTLKSTQQYGQMKTRKLGHSMEFEQIKNYVRGDDIRHINWKATAKRNSFRVNQYTDEKSKEVYCIIDTGRSMKYPFNGLALVDYAINSTLVILQNAINTQDKAGLMSFNKKSNHFLKAENRPSHIQKILEKLYAIQPQFLETDFSTLYVQLRRLISQRALLFLFTNFDNYDAFERQRSYLQAINKSHVLVVVFFTNVELEDRLENNTIKDPVQKAILEKQINEKNRIVSELNQRGIQTILTRPEALTINLLNKYLEIKAKALV